MSYKKIRSFFPHFDAAVLVASLAVYIGVCSWLIGRSSIWFDEAFGAYLIRFSFSELTYFTGMDVHPPLYYYALKVWSMVFGTSDVALRSMSVFFGALALVGGFFLVRKLFGRKAAYFSVMLLAISPMLIRYGIEMRMYTMVIAIVLAGTFALLRATQMNERKWWIIYGILLALGMYTHYMTAIAWLSHWVWRAVVTRQRSLRLWRKRFLTKEWILTHIFAVTLFLPWLPWLALRVGDVQVNGFWIPTVTPEILLDFVTNFFLYLDAGKVTTILTLLLIAIFWFLLSANRTATDALPRPSCSAFALVSSLVFAPPVILLLLSIPPLQSIFIDRYMMASLYFASILIGVIIGHYYDGKRLKAMAGMALLITASVVGISNVAYYGNYNKFGMQSNRARDVVEAIRDTDDESRPIIADTPWLYYEAAQYSKPEQPVYFIDKYMEYEFGALEMLQQSDIGKIKDLDDFLKNNPEVWYIGRPVNQTINPPAGDMTKVRSLLLNDPIAGGPAYEAALFRLNAE